MILLGAQQDNNNNNNNAPATKGNTKSTTPPHWSTLFGGSTYEWDTVEMITEIWEAAKYGGNCSFCGLESECKYEIRVRYKNKHGWSPGSPSTTFTTKLFWYPEKMKSPIAANRGGSGIMLAFDAEIAKKTQNSTEFEVSVSPDNIVWTRRFRTETSPVLVDNLHRGCYFFFRVRSKNARGWGKCSDPHLAKVVTTPVPPIADLPRFLSHTAQTITLMLPISDSIKSRQSTPGYKLTQMASLFGSTSNGSSSSKPGLLLGGFGKSKIKAPKKRRHAHGGTPTGGSSTVLQLGDAMHMNRRIAIESDDYEDAVHGVPDEWTYAIEYSTNRHTWISIEIQLNSDLAHKPFIIPELQPCQHYFFRVRQKNKTGWSPYNSDILQICTRDYKAGDHVLWWNQGPWVKKPAWTGGVIANVPTIARQGNYGVRKGKHISSVLIEHIKEAKKDGREEAKHRWSLVSSLVSTAKSFTMTDKHTTMFQDTSNKAKRKGKTTKQLMADRHDEVNTFLTLDDVNMTPGNIVNTTNIDSRKESKAVSFKGTVKVLLFASKLKNKMKAKQQNKKRNTGGRKLLLPLATSDVEREMRRRLSMRRVGMKS